MTLTVDLPNDVEQRLRERATREGKRVEEYSLELIARDERLADDEFERLLDDLASGPELPPLPADFSRADLYADHD